MKSEEPFVFEYDWETEDQSEQKSIKVDSIRDPIEIYPREISPFGELIMDFSESLSPQNISRVNSSLDLSYLSYG